ncbi:polysaccharide biosynthesis tyrosine autokinase [Herbiconiux sp. VKM Ac-2851]|uniref:polysaccharide biosynthesis tyrosine autokinase n=1 Tax=Herbiconiux sp. VKM Ac-2851 TaxID=2739025 RepID=UPI0015659576|nr:polysaccharide biosynthesis tyrosine autokinase [Herbiconiux sp. VKM Ac-2851]NQX35581.1 polysaccharide biosynthesis tyrosine autokinase [Herbiconiux sp. VKM Ac-2851]
MELRSYFGIVRAHWIVIVLLTLVGGAAGFGWSLLQPRVFEADASGYVSAGSTTDTGNALVGDNLAQSKVKSYIDIGASRAVAQYAIDSLGLEDVSPEQLVNRIAVTNPSSTVLLKVSATGATPVAARDLAEAWLRGIAAQIQTIENPGSEAGASTGVVQLVPLDSAVLPTSPTSPNTRLAILAGLVAGLLLSLAYAILRHTLDRRIRSAELVEKETGLSVIGAIPVDRRFTDDDRLVSMDGATDYSNLGEDDAAVAEALREVRTNLQFMDVDNPPRVIVVTSPLPGDGKSTTIANLAIALAASGQRVILVDADLRRPTVHKTFNLVGAAGLTDVLAGRSAIADVLQPWGTSGRLAILASGKIPPNPSELLGSERMHSLLAELSTHAIVLIDAPPLIPVTDAAILTHNTDGALIVGSVGRTTYEGLNKALQNLQKANARPLGIILNRVPRRGGGYGYGYGYGYSYQAHADQPETRIEDAPRTLDDVHSTPIANSFRGDLNTAVRADADATFDSILSDGGLTDAGGAPGHGPTEGLDRSAAPRLRSRRDLRQQIPKS